MVDYSNAPLVPSDCRPVLAFLAASPLPCRTYREVARPGHSDRLPPPASDSSSPYASSACPQDRSSPGSYPRLAYATPRRLCHCLPALKPPAPATLPLGRRETGDKLRSSYLTRHRLQRR